jgi:putative lipoic acid-binding regulatory protein
VSDQGDDEKDVDERARAIALLEANHAFPTDYAITVIANNDDTVAELVIAAAFEEGQPAPAGCHDRRPSSGGKYVSHRLTIRARDAEHVLIIYARLRAIDGVRTIL